MASKYNEDPITTKARDKIHKVQRLRKNISFPRFHLHFIQIRPENALRRQQVLQTEAVVAELTSNALRPDVACTARQSLTSARSFYSLLIITEKTLMYRNTTQHSTESLSFVASVNSINQ